MEDPTVILSVGVIGDHAWGKLYELIRSYNIIDRIPRPRERTFIIPECVAVTSSSVILPPTSTFLRIFITHALNYEQLLKVKATYRRRRRHISGGFNLPWNLSSPGKSFAEQRETRLLPAADYHPGMFIKSYDSFRQFLSFIRLKVRLGCRSDCALSASPLTPRTYISSISFINFRNSHDILANKLELSELRFGGKFRGIYIILYSSEISLSFKNLLAKLFLFSFFLLTIESLHYCPPFIFSSIILRFYKKRKGNTNNQLHAQ